MLIVPICLLLLVLAIGYLLFVPFDIMRYHKMPYYKDLKKKYRCFLTSSDVVKLYNRIAKDKLPIEYYSNNGYEYFIKDNEVFILGWGQDGFDVLENGEWGFQLNENTADEQFVPMKEILKEKIAQLKEEHRNLPTKFLLFYSEITDADRFEKAKECPYFHCADSIEDFATVVPNYKWEDIVEMLYDKHLDAFADEVIEVIYSKDKSMRYVITKSEKGLFWYGLEAIYQFDEDEWKYICSNDGALPAMWEAHPDCNYNSIFASKEDALKEIKTEPFYKQYF